MLRASLLVLLSCACGSALAQNGRASMPGTGTACQEIADKATPEATLPASDNARAKVVLRSKYMSPTAPTIPSLPTTRGGGDDGDASAPALPRPRGPKWHSFLPGMFR